MQLHERQETRPSRQARERVGNEATRHDTTWFVLRCLYRSLIACSAALLLLLVLGPVMLP